jgi:propionyl-CoA carboxylase alpha chain
LGRNGADIEVDGEPVEVTLHSATPTGVDLTTSGVRRRYAVAVAGDLVDVDSSLGASTHRVLPLFTDPAAALAAGSLTAPMPGSIVRVLVAAGDSVEPGQPLVVLEAMKMEHTVAAPAAGVITELRVQAGQQVDSGAVLAVLSDDA